MFFSESLCYHVLDQAVLIITLIIFLLYYTQMSSALRQVYLGHLVPNGSFYFFIFYKKTVTKSIFSLDTKVSRLLKGKWTTDSQQAHTDVDMYTEHYWWVYCECYLNKVPHEAEISSIPHVKFLSWLRLYLPGNVTFV